MTALHVTVLKATALDALNITGARAAGTYVDATFGRGGHARSVLAALQPAGRLIALDRDLDAVAAARAIDDPRFSIHHAAFSQLPQVLALAGVAAVDGVLFDLGISSPQIDEGHRGFSFNKDGPLDMRMDTTRGPRADEWLQQVAEDELANVIGRYGEERFAKQIARAIVAARSREPLRTTGELARVVAGAVRTREPGQHPATRTFQAVRIFINQEHQELAVALHGAFESLAPGGRMVVISFHSLEDRMVKHFMRDKSTADQLPRGLPVRAADIAAAPARLIGRAIKPDSAEVAANPRARSAIMRVMERVAA